jgi:tRNA nucleotidyltransferase (CCA-adding enzyme)
MSMKTAKAVCELLQKANYEAYLIGGSVRELLLNKIGTDIDICTNALPCRIKSVFWLFPVYNIGEKFGTITVLYNGEKVEITTYRSESQFTDKRNELNIKFESSLKEDLKRRDLTVNAMAFNPCTGELIDFFNGKEDLNNHIIRFVGEPTERIKEDPLRMLRAIRFSAKLNSVIEENSFNAIKQNANLIKNVAYERIKEELLKILSIKDCSFALEYLLKTGILEQILPELSKLERVPQPKKYHKFTVLYHMFNTVLYIPETKPLLRFVALIHDIGKTYMREHSPYFPNHELDGTKLFLNGIAQRFKFSVEETQYISFLMSYHMSQFGFKHVLNNKSAHKRYLSHMEENIKYLDDLFILFNADKEGTGREDDVVKFTTQETYKQLKEIIDNKEPLQIRDLNISGTDLINLGLPIDSTLSNTLKMLLDAVINGDIENTKEALTHKTQMLIQFGAIQIKNKV